MTTKILALTDALGNLVRLELLPGDRSGLFHDDLSRRCRHQLTINPHKP
jgi:hypothetical protein